MGKPAVPRPARIEKQKQKCVCVCGGGGGGGREGGRWGGNENFKE